MENGLLVRSEVDHDVSDEAEVASAQGVEEAFSQHRHGGLMNIYRCVVDGGTRALSEVRDPGFIHCDCHRQAIMTTGCDTSAEATPTCLPQTPRPPDAIGNYRVRSPHRGAISKSPVHLTQLVYSTTRQLWKDAFD